MFTTTPNYVTNWTLKLINNVFCSRTYLPRRLKCSISNSCKATGNAYVILFGNLHWRGHFEQQKAYYIRCSCTLVRLWWGKVDWNSSGCIQRKSFCVDGDEISSSLIEGNSWLAAQSNPLWWRRRYKLLVNYGANANWIWEAWNELVTCVALLSSRASC